MFGLWLTVTLLGVATVGLPMLAQLDRRRC